MFAKLLESTKSKKYTTTFVSRIHETSLKLKNIPYFFSKTITTTTKTQINLNKNAFEITKFLTDTETLKPTTIFTTFSKQPHINKKSIIKDSIKR